MQDQFAGDRTVLERTPAAVVVLAANAAATEQRGRPAVDSLAAVAKLGGFALAVPRSPGEKVSTW